MGADKASQLKYSILLPTHNRADVLPFAIKSVLRQTIENFELLVVGDGCTDETAEVVASFNDRRIRWFDLPKTPHFGYANRNIALREARGELIAFLAHDDLWLPDHLELLASCLEQSGAEIAYSRPLWVIPRGLFAPLVFNLHDALTLDAFLNDGYNSIPAGCFVHRRECFDKYGYWNDTLPSCADRDMWARIIEGGRRENFAYLPEPTCLHFRANWRKESDVGQPQLLVWKALHAFGNFMPPALKVEVPHGMSEQEACWTAIQANGRKWPLVLRNAVHSVIEKRVSISDEMIMSVLDDDEVDRLNNDKELRSEARDYLGRLANGHDEGSLAWKFVRRIHGTLDVVVPPHTRRGRSWIQVKKVLKRAL